MLFLESQDFCHIFSAKLPITTFFDALREVAAPESHNTTC